MIALTLIANMSLWNAERVLVKGQNKVKIALKHLFLILSVEFRLIFLLSSFINK